jgi:hypothetical protein
MSLNLTTNVREVRELLHNLSSSIDGLDLQEIRDEAIHLQEDCNVILERRYGADSH